MTAIIETSPLAALVILLRSLKLPTIARHAEEVAQLGEREGWPFLRAMHHLVELEVHERRRRRIERNQRHSELPADKTLATLKRSRLPTKVAKVLPTLCEGSFVERGDTVVVSEEVGLAVHPDQEIARRFVDALGWLNQAVAEAADEVLLVVAGRVLELGRDPTPPVGGR